MASGNPELMLCEGIQALAAAHKRGDALAAKRVELGRAAQAAIAALPLGVPIPSKF